MKKTQTPLTVIALLLLLTGCAFLPNKSAEVIPTIQISDSRIQSKFPGYTMQDYEQGESLYQQQCGRCHTLHPANLLNEDQWASIIPKMAVKVNKKVGETVMSTKEEQAVFQYLFAQGMATEPHEHSH